MQNITINIPNNYEENIQKLIKLGITPNRSEAIRNAIRDYLHKEYDIVLPLFDFFHKEKADISDNKSLSESKAIKLSLVIESRKLNTQTKQNNGGKKDSKCKE